MIKVPSTGQYLSMRLEEVLALPSVTGHSGLENLEQELSMVADDSRTLKSGGLFVAKRGFQADGRRFVQDALGRGAVAVVSEEALEDVPAIRVGLIHQFEAELLSRWYAGVESSMRFVGITGTKGKTSTAFFMYDWLQRQGEAVCYIGTVGIYDRTRASTRNHHTTPGVYTLYALLDRLRSTGHQICIMEVSSHALDQLRINGLRYAAAGFTNLSRDHLDYHATMDEYFKAKQALFFQHLDGPGIVNCDDEWGRTLHTRLPADRRLGYSSEGSGDVAWTLEEDDAGSLARCGDFLVRVGMPGRYNAENGMLAALLLRAIGFVTPAYEFGQQGIPGRLERVDARGITVYVDYAHSPDSLEKVLALLRSRVRGRLICVFGCTGDRDRGKRPVMAGIAERYSDHVVITSDDPHSEDPLAICREVETGMQGKDYHLEVDRRKAIALALEMAKPGDTVLVAGKGHERFQVFGDYELPFSDREVVEELLSLP